MRHTDLKFLLPHFRTKVELVLTQLAARGYTPQVWETLRSVEKAAENARKGVGSANSLHIWGGAVDIICKNHKWGCFKQSPICGFFDELGQIARANGLFWGGDWKSRDCPHVQAVPVAEQRAFRAAKDRDGYLRARTGALT